MDYLQRYAVTARINVNMELAERFDWSMRNDGDKPIKQQMATARRAATTLATLLKDFTDLPDSQAQQLRQSASTLRALAESLEGLARFAKGYQAFYKAEQQREHEARIDKLASERWGGNAQAAEFEWDLITELQSNEGRRALGMWMHSQGKYTDISADKFHGPFQSATLLGINKAREAANCLDLVKWNVHKYSEARLHCHVGTIDYEHYLSVRKTAAAQAQTLMQKLTSQAAH